MKTSLIFQEFYNNIMNNIDDTLNVHITNMYNEFNNKLIEEKNKLIEKISEGENIDVNYLKNKYLKSKELNKTERIETEEDIEELLDKVIIDNNTYYYENKENGKIFDSNFKEVGIFQNNKLSLFKS